MLLDILWYYGNIQLKESERVKIIIQDNKSICEIKSATKEDVGYYTCKAINEIGINVSRAKFDLFSTAATHSKLTDKIVKNKPKLKKKILRRLRKTTSEKSEKETHKTIVEIIPAQQEVTVEISPIKEISAQSTTVSTTQIITIPKKTEFIKNDIAVEAVIKIKDKLNNNTISQEDILIIREHEEVNKMLQSIEIETYHAAEAPLRDLATIGVLINYGLTISEVTQMYEKDVFLALKSPESQSALVQLVEREGHDELIAQVLTEHSTMDEHILAATVGFRSFIRMIEICQITIEEIITKFVKEDFITQEWKFAAKEVCLFLFFFFQIIFCHIRYVINCFLLILIFREQYKQRKLLILKKQ